MSLRTLCRSVLTVALLASALVCSAADLDIIAKARVRLGGEQALSSVHSIRYSGVLTLADGKSLPMEIVIQSPLQQRLTVTGADRITITGLDGFDGWQRTVDIKDATRWNLTLLGKEQLRRLRANTFENLNFFKIEGFPGTVEDLGLVTIEGKSYHKVAYRHDAQIRFFRYFEPDTARLAFSETDEGANIREEGELVVDGVRFAKKIYSTSRNKSGAVETAVIEFDKIILNESFAGSLFAVPMAR